ncbi:MAG: tetratricopeptide repeat protein, partial [Acidobacteriota bacterium]
VRAAAAGSLQSAGPAMVLRLALDMIDDDDLSVRLEAARALATVAPPQIPPARRAAVDAALAEYRESQLVNAERAQAHLNLGWLALQRGDPAAAEQSYLTALRLEPMFVPTYINLADLYRTTGRDPEGEELLRRALAIAPDSGAVHYALGLLLVRGDRLDEAVETLRRAARLAPDTPHYAYVYAVAVQTGGDTRGALQILDDALARFPDDRELLFGAAAFSRDLSDLDRAIAYARRMVAADPADTQAAAFLRELEQQRRP